MDPGVPGFPFSGLLQAMTEVKKSQEGNAVIKEAVRFSDLHENIISLIQGCKAHEKQPVMGALLEGPLQLL